MLEALYYALTGESTIPIVRGITQQSSVIHLHRKLGTDSTQVDLDYTYKPAHAGDEVMVRVKRALEGKRTESASIYGVDANGKDDVEIAAGDAVAEKLHEILACSPQFIRNALLLHEGEIFEFLLHPGEAFLEELDKFQSVDPLPALLEEVSGLQREFKKRAKARAGDIEDLEKRVVVSASHPDPEAVQAQLEEKQAELDDVVVTHEKLTRNKQQISKKRQPSREALERSKARERDLEALARHVESRDKILTGLSKAVEKWGETRDAVPEGDHPGDLLANFLTAIEQVLRESTDALESLTTADREIRDEMAELNGQIKAEADKLKKIKEAGDACPLCEQSLTPEHRKRLQGEIADRVREMQERVSDFQEQLQDLARDRDRQVQERNQLEKQYGQLERLQERYTALSEQFQAAVEKFPADADADARTWQFDSVTGATLKETIAEVQDKITSHQARLATQDEKFDRVTAELLTATQRKSKLETEIENLQNTASDTAGDATPLDDVKTDYERERGHYVHSAFLAGVLKKALEASLQELRETATQQVKNSVRDLWKQFHAGAVNASWTDRFIPVIEVGAEQLSALQMSEAERLEIFLGIRTALADTYGRADFLILDEPFHHLDADNKGVLQEYLQWILENTRIKQVILTSFEDAVKDAREWDNLIELA